MHGASDARRPEMQNIRTPPTRNVDEYRENFGTCFLTCWHIRRARRPTFPATSAGDSCLVVTSPGLPRCHKRTTPAKSVSCPLAVKSERVQMSHPGAIVLQPRHWAGFGAGTACRRLPFSRGLGHWFQHLHLLDTHMLLWYIQLNPMGFDGQGGRMTLAGTWLRTNEKHAARMIRRDAQFGTLDC
ncbi:hypothetical protein BH20CHL2_BH20CHL2_09520 [soil metagenome]